LQNIFGFLFWRGCADQNHGQQFELDCHVPAVTVGGIAISGRSIKEKNVCDGNKM
jgi:hypothetical protein